VHFDENSARFESQATLTGPAQKKFLQPYWDIGLQD
jgi:hypothetical protein